MQEILRNIQANDDRNDVAVFEDVQTPVNEPPPQFQDDFYDKAAVDRVEWVWGGQFMDTDKLLHIVFFWDLLAAANCWC